jgi:hypothetical protein
MEKWRLERNHLIQEQELLALIYGLEKWRHYLFGMETTGKIIRNSLEGKLVGSSSYVSFL